MGLCLSKPPAAAAAAWSDLPPELGGLIFCRLLSNADRLSFRAVCRQWRLAAQDRSLPPALPWVRLNDRSFQSLPGGELRRLKALDVVVSRTRTATASDGWLMYDSERYRYDKHIRPCILLNPSTGATIYGLPESIINPVRKMTVCSPDLIAAIINGNTAVGFYRPGAPSWSISPAPSCRSYKDIALCHGKLYALSEGEELFSHELLIDAGGGRVVEHVINERASPVYDKCYPYERYLVASCDKLFLVRWWYSLWVFLMMDPSMEQKCDAIKMQVFEADLEMGRWREVKDDGLDGQALFVSRNCSKGVRLCTNDPRFQGDRVYFLGAELDLIDTGFFMPYTCGCYDMRNDRVSELFLKRTWKITDRRRGRPEWFFPCM